MNFQPMSDIQRLKMLELPRTGKLSMVLDTDTFNEVDDQFALAYALLSGDRLNVEAVYAAPFQNDRAATAGDGMEQSYREILRLLGKMHRSDVTVLKGSRHFLTAADVPEESPAASDLIQRAHAHSPENPLYVVCISAITNVASALLKDPSILPNIVVVWLGGNSTDWPSAREFNLSEDLHASRLIFNCGVALVQIPAMCVSSHLLTTLAELKENLSGKNELCDALIELFAAYSPDHFGWSKEIWDISAVAYLINPDWVPTRVIHSPILTDCHTYSPDRCRHLIRCAFFVSRNPVFRDLFTKLTSLKD